MIYCNFFLANWFTALLFYIQLHLKAEQRRFKGGLMEMRTPPPRETLHNYYCVEKRAIQIGFHIACYEWHSEWKSNDSVKTCFSFSTFFSFQLSFRTTVKYVTFGKIRGNGRIYIFAVQSCWWCVKFISRTPPPSLKSRTKNTIYKFNFQRIRR